MSFHCQRPLVPGSFVHLFILSVGYFTVKHNAPQVEKSHSLMTLNVIATRDTHKQLDTATTQVSTQNVSVSITVVLAAQVPPASGETVNDWLAPSTRTTGMCIHSHGNTFMVARVSFYT